jgi:hypothetical protein
MGIVRQEISDVTAGTVIFSGLLQGIDTSQWSVNDSLYVSTTAGVLTNVKPTSLGSGIQAIARVLFVNASTGVIQVVGSGRVNDIPNFTAPDKYWYGNGTGASVEGTVTSQSRTMLASAELETLGFACSDETTALTTGIKITTDVPYNFTVTRVYATLAVAGITTPTTVDILEDAVSILNAAISITQATNNAEITGAVFAGATTSAALTKGNELTINIPTVDSGGADAGLKVFLHGYRT